MTINNHSIKHQLFYQRHLFASGAAVDGEGGLARHGKGNLLLVTRNLHTCTQKKEWQMTQEELES